MALKIGIIGLPNVGKSTLFNALTAARVAAHDYPFCTIDPNVGMASIEDERLQAIAQVVKPEIVTGSAIEFVDIAGLVKGASRGEGLGNQFLGHIRQVDAILHVVRAFPGASGSITPLDDVEIVETELLLADMEMLHKRLEKATKMLKTADPIYRQEIKQLEAALQQLDQGQPLRTNPMPLPEGVFLLTDKPVFYALNINEAGLEGGSSLLTGLVEKAEAEGSAVVSICAAVEEELVRLEPEERQVFQQELGIEMSGLQKVVQAGMDFLQLISFYTVKGRETRSWLIPRQTRAPQAAGCIHSDMERGFIRAEVINWQDLVQVGSFAGAKEQGLLRIEGRDYFMGDGDVVQFRFNV